MNFKKIHIKDHVIIVVNLKSATIEHTEGVKTIFDELMIDNVKKVIIDLTECDFIDSTFMGLLVRCHKDMERNGGSLKIVCNGKVRFLLHDVTHLSSVIKLYTTREEAIKTN
jgi:anti-sigma B factor antagonist/stage II sporulation protein AA (anti-sigma F factor antagonist)